MRTITHDPDGFAPRKAKHLRHFDRTPFQRLDYIEERIRQGCSPLPVRVGGLSEAIAIAEGGAA